MKKKPQKQLVLKPETWKDAFILADTARFLELVARDAWEARHHKTSNRKEGNASGGGRGWTPTYKDFDAFWKSRQESLQKILDYFAQFLTDLRKEK